MERKNSDLKLKILCLGISLTLLVAATGCASPTPAAEPVEPAAVEPTAAAAEPEAAPTEPEATGPAQVVFVTSTSRLGDQGFNDGVAAGVTQAATEFGLDYKIVQSYADTDYVPNLSRSVESGYTVVMTAGWQMSDALKEVAPRYPNAKFAGADVEFETSIDNVREILFAEEEASYLLGVLTASMLEAESHPIYKDHKALGIVAGVEQPAVVRFITGYIAGARSVNKDVPIYVYYTGTWQNPDLFREAAITAFNRGAGSIFEIGGVAGLSIIEASKEYGFLEITTDQDKNNLSPDTVLSSAMKDLTQATYLTIKDAVEGTWTGGKVRYTLANGGVKIAPYHSLSQYVPDAVQQAVDDAEAAIIAGDIIVPKTLEEGAALLEGIEFEGPAE